MDLIFQELTRKLKLDDYLPCRLLHGRNDDCRDDLSDAPVEEDPVPGKFVGGPPKGKRPAKVKKKRLESISARPRPGEIAITLDKEGRALVTVRFIRSKFGLGSTFKFRSNQQLPMRLDEPDHSANLEEVACRTQFRHPQCGMFYKLGKGAVAFRCVLSVFNSSGLQHTNTSKWNVYWAKRVMPEEWREVNEYQRINHFPGSWGVGRKDNLFRNLRRMQCAFPGSYDFIPKTYLLPVDESVLRSAMEESTRKDRIYILKPSASSCGKGIRLITEFPDDAMRKIHGDALKSFRRGGGRTNESSKTSTSYVVQEYIADPFLIDGYKFDLRVYVCVTGFDPLRIYVYDEGLVRFCSEQYSLDSENLSDIYRHLTNYSLNKNSQAFVNPTSPGAGKNDGDEEAAEDDRPRGEEASKWTISSFRHHLHQKGIGWSHVQEQINDIVVKTFLSVEAEILSQMRSYAIPRNCCFQLYGFDIILDSELQASLLEVNVMPSLSCTTPLDKCVKFCLIEDVLTLAGAVPFNRKLSGGPDDQPAEVIGNPVFLPAATRMTRVFPEDTQAFLRGLSWDERITILECEDELARRGRFTRLFPSADAESYMPFLASSKAEYNTLLIRWEKEKAAHTPQLVSDEN